MTLFVQLTVANSANHRVPGRTNRCFNSS